jgi:hypothetical protein
LPALIERSGYIPIPRIDYSDKQADISVEGLVLRAETLFPNFIDLETRTHLRFSPIKPSAVGPGSTYGRITIRLEQLQADVRDCHVTFAKCVSLACTRRERSGQVADFWTTDPDPPPPLQEGWLPQA